MSIDDARSDAYYQLFKGIQYGGALAAFQGSPRYQYGEGIGDIFAGIWRTVRPVVLSGAKAFLGALGDAQSQGIGLKDALKASIAPTAAAALGSAAGEIEKRQKGSGRKRLYKGRRGHKSKKRKTSNSSKITYNF